MRTLAIRGARAVDLVELERPEPGPGEVLVRVAASALCGSEMRAYRGDGHPAGGNSGHEAAGTIVQTGGGVTSLTVGDRVGLCAVVGCGRCAECAAGRTTWCPERAFVGGMHSDFVVIAARACHRLPDDVDWSTGTLISGDGMGVPFHTLTKIPDGARTIAVFGLGPVGLGTVLLQTYLGREVIGIDIAQERIALAKQFGADATVVALSTPDLTADAVRALTGGRGADVCVEAAGAPPTVEAAFRSVRMGGTVIFNGEQPAVRLSPSEDFIRRDITASGAWFYHFSEFGPMLALVREGFEVGRLVTHSFPFEDAALAYDLMDRGLTGKVLLVRE